MTAHAFEQTLCIAADHPSLAGHFPGQPLVPGVILLEQVALAVRAWRGQRLTCVLEAKFMQPLLPAQRALLRLNAATQPREVWHQPPARLRFEILHDGSGHVLARGLVEVAA